MAHVLMLYAPPSCLVPAGKSKVVSSKPEKSASSRSLSPAVLKRHQQQCDSQSVSSVGFAADTRAIHVSCGPGAAAASVLQPTMQPAPYAGQGPSPSPPAGLSAKPGAPAAERSVLDAVYNSPFYQPSCASNSPQTPKAGVAASAALPPIPKSGSASLLPLRYSTSYGSTATPAGGETPSPSATPRGVSVLYGSSGSSNRAHSNDPSQHGLLSGPQSSRDYEAMQAAPGQAQLQQSATPFTAAIDAVLPALAPGLVSPITPVRQMQMQQMQRSPMQHSPDMFASAQHTQLLQLLQAPKQQRPGLQQLRPASNPTSSMLLAGRALAAYPAVAAALSRAASGSLLQGRSTGAVQQGTRAVAHAQVLTAPPQTPSVTHTPPRHPATQSSLTAASAAPGSPFAALAGQFAAAAAVGAVSGPHAPTAAAVAELEASTNPEDVQQWLLRTALLEDELQGRALEVAEELQVQHERRELFASLASVLQRCPAGSADYEAAVQEAADSLGVAWGVGSRGALYRARRGTGRGSPGIR